MGAALGLDRIHCCSILFATIQFFFHLPKTAVEPLAHTNHSIWLVFPGVLAIWSKLNKYDL